MRFLISVPVLAIAASAAMATPVVSTYDDLPESFLGESYTYNGITYSHVNDVTGYYPGGEMFTPGDPFSELGSQLAVEKATYHFDAFPGWGSASHVLTFGRTFIPGDNLTVGPLATVTMSLDTVADAASVELGHYENGPWGGINVHFAAYRNGTMVGEDVLVIAGDDPNGRDNPAIASLSLDGVEFDELRMFSTLNGDYTAPRIMIDNLTYNPVPAPSTLAAVLGIAGLSSKRRRA